MKTAFIALVVLLTACGNTTQTTEETVDTHAGQVAQTSLLLDAAEFKAMLAEQTDYVLIDVRTPGEVAGGRIKGAKNIDINSRSFEADLDALDKSKTVFVYCAKGGRSGRAASMLAGKGFAKVVDLKGGMTAWNAAGFEVE